MSRTDVRGFLDRHALLARKDLGQNFLIDDRVAERLTQLAGVEAGDFVIEVGTGTGVLTRALAARAERVVTLDVDAGLVRALRAEEALPGNVELRHEDVLSADLAAIARSATGPVRLVSNLPYSISGPVLRRLLDLRELLVDWSVMLQREVAERLLATPGTKTYGSLTVLHGLTVRAQRLTEVQSGCFFPEPQVRSIFLRFVPLAEPLLAPEELRTVERVVRAGFGNRRKTLVNSLLRGGLPGLPGLSGDALRAVLADLGIDARARGETLTPKQFLDLTHGLFGTAQNALAPGERAGGLMHPGELLDQLLDLARAAGLEVRQVAARAAGEGDVAVRSGTCRVKGRLWVMLVASDGLEERIDVLSGALATHARSFLEERYLPPAIRERLGPGLEGA
ncbi:MAG: ribosomal RNA small subunit methyltransferase A [Deltaproteobacteria bacterium]|nr:ribosomal RNA small subunit methyltransferase A [Deltaproteobacteria bacterium]